ncbi:MAG: hypothetical protein WBA12_10400 [Catalinimonas sp.]
MLKYGNVVASPPGRMLALWLVAQVLIGTLGVPLFERSCSHSGERTVGVWVAPESCCGAQADEDGCCERSAEWERVEVDQKPAAAALFFFGKASLPPLVVTVFPALPAWPTLFVSPPTPRNTGPPPASGRQLLRALHTLRV